MLKKYYRRSLALTSCPTPRHFFLLTSLCTIPMIWTPGTGWKTILLETHWIFDCIFNGHTVFHTQHCIFFVFWNMGFFYVWTLAYNIAISSTSFYSSKFKFWSWFLADEGPNASDVEALFHPVRRKVGAKDVECQRISQVITQNNLEFWMQVQPLLWIVLNEPDAWIFPVCPCYLASDLEFYCTFVLIFLQS